MKGVGLARVVRAIKRGVYSTPIGMAYIPRYNYMFSPAELALLCRSIERTSQLGGPVAEIGCFRGETTLFLNRFMDNIGSQVPYYAFDTFEGFTPSDIEFESTSRGKAKPTLISGFSVNRQDWFDDTMKRNGFSRVQSRRVDANAYGFSELTGCSFCLIDVDLYRPVLAALRRVYDLAAPGATIVVDDCRKTEHHYDGSYQAYSEFTTALGIGEKIEFGKLGIIEKAS